MHDFKLPLEEPVLIFAIVLFIALLVSVLLRKTVIPNIVGIILIGVIIGPQATNLIADNDTIKLFSHVGLLYIMFLAGLELDISTFLENKTKSIVFGVLTFLLPFVTGYYTGIYLLSLDPIIALLIGIMLASNTLVAFPLTGRLGISKTKAIGISVSGTVIADSIVLIILAFTTSGLLNENPNGQWFFLLRFTLFSILILYIMPKISRWFFKNITADGYLQFLFTLSILFIAAFAAEFSGAEPIIGAFFAGLALNKIIPGSSTLMNRLDFIGNALFIPFFLLSVGMLFDPEILFTGPKPLLVALLLFFMAIASKYGAALFTKFIFKLTYVEMNTIFALTTARAAATLAIAIIGVEYNLIDDDLFNAIIVLIIFTSLVSSFFTDKAGKKLAKTRHIEPKETKKLRNLNILVPVANPRNIEALVDLSMLMVDNQLNENIYPLSIIKDSKHTKTQIKANKPIIENIEKQAASAGHHIHSITRVDVNIPTAISRVAKELNITDIIIGWSGRNREIEKLFSNMLEVVLRNTANTVIVSHLPKPIQLTNQITVYIPANAELEIGFRHLLRIINRLSKQLSAPLVFNTLSSSRPDQEKVLNKILKGSTYKIIEHDQWPEFTKIRQNTEQDLTIFINSRLRTVSFSRKFYRLTYQMPEELKPGNVLNVYTSNDAT